MHMQSCDLCDNPAYVHETILRSGVVKARHLCRAHGLKLWRDAVVPANEHLEKQSRDRAMKSAVTIPPTDHRKHRTGR